MSRKARPAEAIRAIPDVRPVTSPSGPSLVELGARRRSVQVAAGLTQDDLAAAVGLNRRTIGRGELGVTPSTSPAYWGWRRRKTSTPGWLLDRSARDEADNR